MRFLKAFSLLHRRTKSETFIPGCIPPNPGGFAISNPNSRPSSLPAGLGSTNADSSDISSVFDFATAKFTPVSANFNHLRGLNHAISTSPLSLNSLSSILVEENMRLREALNMWFSEYSKANGLLQQCRSELAFDRDKIRTLQQQTARDQELIRDLKEDIFRYEKRFEALRDPGSPLSHEPCSRDQSNPVNNPHHTLLLPGSSHSATSLLISNKTRTLDEYTSALRMTLSTRRQLRDQKKVCKFWKNMALTARNHDDIITPSTSAISSVHESLPPERKRAIDALMRERGWPYPQAQSPEPKTQVDDGSSEPPPKATLSADPLLTPVHPASSIAANLGSTPSNNSVGSRLAPLASESLKAEINMFFGIQGPEKLVSSSSKKFRSAVASSSTTSKTMGESPSRSSDILRLNNLSFSFGSYGDLRQRFSNLYSQDYPPRVKLPSTNTNNDLMQNPEPNTGSSCLAESSAPSGSSRIFGEAMALLQGQRDTVLYSKFLSADTNGEEVIKPLSSGRSWQRYIAPAAKQIPSKTGIPKKKVFAGKENAVLFSKPLFLIKKTS